MPRAVASKETAKFTLQSVEGGFVVLRKMTYGELLRRRDMTQSMGQSDNGKGVQVSFNFTAVQIYDYQHCIVEHNLEGEDDKPLDFSNEQHVVDLDPAIAQEVESLIDAFNNPTTDEARKFLRERIS